ncbi:MAG: hypothetical protein JW931_08015 [Methanomicrobiaceae archaeon]|nr:hypothetical protein [Methanomicrobiaceae archaeon]
MKLSNRRVIIFTITLISLIFICPVAASGDQVTRSVTPELPGPGEVVDVVITLPDGFFGAVVEELPEGFQYAGSQHPSGGIKFSEQTLVFAVTGEKEIKYSIRIPGEGCGWLKGTWENLGDSSEGDITAVLISTPGADPESCGSSNKSPGFGALIAISGCFAGMLVLIHRRRE